MKEFFDRIETQVVKLIKNQVSITLTVIVMIIQLLLMIVIGGTAPTDSSMSDLITWEINSLRFLLLPTALALYFKSIIYLVSEVRTSGNGRGTYNPLNSLISILITLAFDNVCFALIPAAFNYTICLAVFQRSLVIYGVTAIVFSIVALTLFKLARNPFAFTPVALVAYALGEYIITKIGFQFENWQLLNDVYIWNLVNPSIKSTMMGDLDAPQVYEFLFYVMIVLAFLLAVAAAIFRQRIGSK